MHIHNLIEAPLPGAYLIRSRNLSSGMSIQPQESLVKSISNYLISRAKKQKKAGDYDAAIHSYRRAIWLLATPQAYFGLTYCYRKKGNILSAQAACKQGLKLKKNAKWFATLAELSRELSDFREECAAYVSAVALDPSPPEWNYRLATLLATLSPTAAVPYFEAALEPPSTSPWKFWEFGQLCEQVEYFDKAVEAYSKAIMLGEGSSPPEWSYRLGILEERRDNPANAEVVLRNAIGKDEHRHAEWPYRLARILKAQGKSKAAREFFEQALPIFAIHGKPNDYLAKVNWADALHECGYDEEAANLLFESAPHVAANQVLLDLISEVADGLGKKGCIENVLPRLRSLECCPGLAKHALRDYLRLCVKYACFPDEAILLAEKALHVEHDDVIVKQAAWDLLSIFYGPSIKLADAGLRVLEETGSPLATNVLNLATMLFRLNLHDRLRSLNLRYPWLVDYSATNVAAAFVALNAGEETMGSECIYSAQKTMRSYETVCTCQEETWSPIRNTEKSVAVVGNASVEIGKKGGEEVDGHDTVVRFNNYNIDPPFNTDYGNKANFVIRPGTNDQKYSIKTKNTTVIISGIRLLDRFNHWDVITKLLEDGQKVGVFPSDLQAHLLQKIRRAPSAGLSVAWITEALRQGRGRTSYYGFSFIDQIKPGNSAHYYESSPPSGRHGWASEARVFREITGQSPALGTPSIQVDKPKIRLLGDHSDYHSGCNAVINYLRQEVLEHGVLTDNDDYDILIVNGEGSMHHDSKAYQSKMKALGIAIGRGKRAYLVNTVWQENSPCFDHVLKHLDGVVVRECASQDDLITRHDTQAIVRIDVSYWATIDESAPYLDMRETMVVNDFYSREFHNFVQLTGGPLHRHAFLDMRELSWSSLVKTLRTASLLVTGRHHAVFAACRAKTPFVALRGNTHKIEGLIDMSGLPIPVCRKPSELTEAIRWAKENKAVYEQFFNWIDQQPKLYLNDILDIKPVSSKLNRL